MHCQHTTKGPQVTYYSRPFSLFRCLPVPVSAQTTPHTQTHRQLAHIGQLRIEDEEEEEEWVDPSGGLLVNILAACEAGDTDKLAVNLADLQQTEHSIDTPGGRSCVCVLWQLVWVAACMCACMCWHTQLSTA